MMRRFYLGQAEQVGDDEVAGIAITAGVKRDGDEWVPAGVDLAGYRANPIVLRNHDPNQPVGTASAVGLTPNGNGIGIRIAFAPLGISPIADETRGLAKSGVLSGISAGILPTETEPLDRYNPRAGVRILACELLEVSLVPVPADPSARVLQRAYQSPATRRAVLRALPAVAPEALRRAAAAIGGNPLHVRMRDVAAEFGHTLTPEQLDNYIAGARRTGSDPIWWLQFELVRWGAVRKAPV